jgi:hypothetical protein
MGYFVYAVVIAIAVVLFVFTGVWGGLAWIVVAGIVLAVVALAGARNARVSSTRTDPTGVTRKTSGGAETANQRVGQS